MTDGARQWCLGQEPADDLPVLQLMQAVMSCCEHNTKRAAALSKLCELLQGEDISNVIELKLVPAQLMSTLFDESGLQAGGRVAVAKALAPLSQAGWCWEATCNRGTPLSAEPFIAERGLFSFPKEKVQRWWNTAPKYTQHTFEGDIRQLQLPEVIFKDLPPPSDYLTYSQMKKVGNTVWLAIQAHPQLRGGGLSSDCADRLAAILGARYPNLEPMNKKSTPENQRKRSWKSYLLTTFKNRRLRTYKGVSLPQGELPTHPSTCLNHLTAPRPPEHRCDIRARRVCKGQGDG